MRGIDTCVRLSDIQSNSGREVMIGAIFGVCFLVAVLWALHKLYLKIAPMFSDDETITKPSLFKFVGISILLMAAWSIISKDDNN
jgi:hypothetical protein